MVMVKQSWQFLTSLEQASLDVPQFVEFSMGCDPEVRAGGALLNSVSMYLPGHRFVTKSPTSASKLRV